MNKDVEEVLKKSWEGCCEKCDYRQWVEGEMDVSCRNEKCVCHKPQENGECTEECKNLGNHGHCTICGLLTQPIVKCKCPERQNGDWVSPQEKDHKCDNKSKCMLCEKKYEVVSPESNWEQVFLEKFGYLEQGGKPNNGKVMNFIRQQKEKSFAEGKREAVEEIKRKIEVLAEIEHDQWWKWSLSLRNTETISPERLERWRKLWVPYSQLAEEEKEQDRIWARKVLSALSKSF